MFGPSHKYTVSVNYDYIATLSPNMEVRFYEYNANDEMIDYKIWNNVPNNGSKTFDADDLAVKVVVFVSVDTISGKYRDRYYVSKIFYLSSGNTNITLNGKTLTQDYSPI
jgi:hypothetical protein